MPGLASCRFFLSAFRFFPPLLCFCFFLPLRFPSSVLFSVFVSMPPIPPYLLFSASHACSFRVLRGFLHCLLSRLPVSTRPHSPRSCSGPRSLHVAWGACRGRHASLIPPPRPLSAVASPPTLRHPSCCYSFSVPVFASVAALPFRTAPLRPFLSVVSLLPLCFRLRLFLARLSFSSPRRSGCVSPGLFLPCSAASPLFLRPLGVRPPLFLLLFRLSPCSLVCLLPALLCTPFSLPATFLFRSSAFFTAAPVPLGVSLLFFGVSDVRHRPRSGSLLPSCFVSSPPSISLFCCRVVSSPGRLDRLCASLRSLLSACTARWRLSVAS